MPLAEAPWVVDEEEPHPLKNSSICHRDLYRLAIVFPTHVVLFVTNT